MPAKLSGNAARWAICTVTILCLCLISVTAFAKRPPLQSRRGATHVDSSGAVILEANLDAADALAHEAEKKELPYFTLLVAPLANLDAPEQTTPLGRLISQQVASRLTQHGFQVIEPSMRLATAFRRQQDALIRAQEATALPQNGASGAMARAALAGYYQQGRELYVSLRLVRLEDNVVLAAYEYILPRNTAVRRLMVDEELESTWSRYVGRSQATSDLMAPAVPQTPPAGPMNFPSLSGDMGGLAVH